jgi:hypothetical protein
MGIAEKTAWPRLADPKRFNHALFGVYFEEDIYEVFCGRFPRAMRAFQWRVAARMRARNLIFIHVPRVAGTSIAYALYGPRHASHLSARYYRTLDPAFFARAESFALLRDPFDHFASAYTFVRAGGTPSCPLSDVFVTETATVRSVDDYLSFLEDRDVLSQDFVMRPQSWFVCDLETGRPLVKSLFLYGEDRERLNGFLAGHGVRELPWLNASKRLALFLSARQKLRIEALYAQDFALVEVLRAERAAQADAISQGMRIAAE